MSLQKFKRKIIKDFRMKFSGTISLHVNIIMFDKKFINFKVRQYNYINTDLILHLYYDTTVTNNEQ